MVTACGKNGRRKNCEKKLFTRIPEGCMSVGKPRKIQLDDAENDLKQMGFRG